MDKIITGILLSGVMFILGYSFGFGYGKEEAINELLPKIEVLQQDQEVLSEYIKGLEEVIK